MEYEITDLLKFVDGSRVFVYKNFSGLAPNSKKEISYAFDKKNLTLEELVELETCLTAEESTIIFNDYGIKRDNVFYMTEDIYLDYLEALTRRMTSNLLRSLADKNLLQIAFDEEKNDFVFWPTQSTEEDTEEET